jgi:SAM-dependent methyltransferase
VEHALPEIPSAGKPAIKNYLRLLLASFLALFFELLVIRYISTEIRVFAYIKNLLLIASFFGLGTGMVFAKPPKRLSRVFPFLAAVLFLLAGFAAQLHLTHLPFPMGNYFAFTTFSGNTTWWYLQGAEYIGAVIAILMLVVAFFIVLGGVLGREFRQFAPLSGYSLNLTGSLGGILAFTALCYLGSSPAVWLLVGLIAALPFIWNKPKVILLFLAVIAAIGLNQGHAIWSPYYRVDLIELPPPAGWNRPSAYQLTVNHDYHQKIVDLSPAFMSRYPNVQPNSLAFSTYELPYQVVPTPKDVLVVGAGTGNDVAAALRHGAQHVDAVEIDPAISRIGLRYHPEHPYSSPRVTMYNDDARAFFMKTRKKYDLIVFGYLDSQTLLTSFSAVRLDNYVYTVESFQEARTHLKAGGSLILAFDSGKSFVTDRLFATLSRVFGVPPRAYFTAYDQAGVVLLEGAARDAPVHLNFPDITEYLVQHSQDAVLATDNWPFLYLSSHTIPLAIVLVLIPFLYWCFIVFKARVGWASIRKPGYLHLFFLGAGFLLLETSGVTRLSLLFGSTWVVNAVVIAAFIYMAFSANAFVMVRPLPHWKAYVGLFLSLGLSVMFPFHVLNALPAVQKVLASAVLIGLPVFFSGMVFSRSFRDFANPSEALGVNLLGAVIGGTLENLVMVGGTAILGVLVVMLYALSAVFIWNPQPTTEFAKGVAVLDPGEADSKL